MIGTGFPPFLFDVVHTQTDRRKTKLINIIHFFGWLSPQSHNPFV